MSNPIQGSKSVFQTTESPKQGQKRRRGAVDPEEMNAILATLNFSEESFEEVTPLKQRRLAIVPGELQLDSSFSSSESEVPEFDMSRIVTKRKGRRELQTKNMRQSLRRLSLSPSRLSLETKRVLPKVQSEKEQLTHAIKKRVSKKNASVLKSYVKQVEKDNALSEFQIVRELGAVFYYLNLSESQLVRRIQRANSDFYTRITNEANRRITECKKEGWTTLSEAQKKVLPLGAISEFILFFTELLLLKSGVWNPGGGALVSSLLQEKCGLVLRKEHRQAVLNTVKSIIKMGEAFSNEVLKKKECHADCLDIVRCELKLPIDAKVGSLEVARSGLNSVFWNIKQLDGEGNCFAIGIIKQLVQVAPLQIFTLFCEMLKTGSIYLERLGPRFHLKDIRNIVGFRSVALKESLTALRANKLYCVKKALANSGQNGSTKRGRVSIEEHLTHKGNNKAQAFAKQTFYAHTESILNRLFVRWLEFVVENDSASSRTVWLDDFLPKLKEKLYEAGKSITGGIPFAIIWPRFKSLVEQMVYFLSVPHLQDRLADRLEKLPSFADNDDLQDYLEGSSLMVVQMQPGHLELISSHAKFIEFLKVILVKCALDRLPDQVQKVFIEKMVQTMNSQEVFVEYISSLATVINKAEDHGIDEEMLYKLGYPSLYQMGGLSIDFARDSLSFQTVEKEIHVDDEESFIVALAKEYKAFEKSFPDSLFESRHPVMLLSSDHFYTSYPFRLKRLCSKNGSSKQALNEIVTERGEALLKAPLSMKKRKKLNAVLKNTGSARRITEAQGQSARAVYSSVQRELLFEDAANASSADAQCAFLEQLEAFEAKFQQVMMETSTKEFLSTSLNPVLRRLGVKPSVKQRKALAENLKKRLQASPYKIDATPAALAYAMQKSLAEKASIILPIHVIEEVIYDQLNLPHMLDLGDLNYEYKKTHHVGLSGGYDFCAQTITLFHREKERYTQVSDKERKLYYETSVFFTAPNESV